jgi:hypothetical protein
MSVKNGVRRAHTNQVRVREVVERDARRELSTQVKARSQSLRPRRPSALVPQSTSGSMTNGFAVAVAAARARSARRSDQDHRSLHSLPRPPTQKDAVVSVPFTFLPPHRLLITLAIAGAVISWSARSEPAWALRAGHSFTGGKS